MKPELRFETKQMRAADLGGESTLPDLLGEMMLQNRLSFDLGEEDEIYEGYGTRENAYPYRKQNLYTRELKQKEIRTAVLENDCLKAVFLPEYGGRLWELWDKASGKNLLYTNDVLRFGNLAVRNAWFSGGVEWNISVIGHTPFTAEPLYTARTETEDGNPVLRMYEYERIRGVVYQMDFWLEQGSPYLNCRMRIVNEGAEVVPMYWWSNIAVPEFEGGRVIVPSKAAYTNTDSLVLKVDIPMVDGIDVTDYKTIPKSVDYFFEIDHGTPKYIANVDRTGFGLLQLSTARQKSRKLFTWGNQDASDRWQEFLTEDAGRYLEIQAGLGKTQYGCIPMAPHTAWEWMEQYGAVQIPKELLQKSHEERCMEVTEQLRLTGRPKELEKKLKGTKAMAKTKALLVYPGNGAGSLAPHGKGTAHLEFAGGDASIQNWKRFFETGLLHCPDTESAPDGFFINEHNVGFLEETLSGENARNWYAWYHLGIGYFVQGGYEEARAAFVKSLELAENPWALHGMACALMKLEDKKEAASHMLMGMEKRRKDISYLKEGMGILLNCGEYALICRFYETLEEKEKNTGMLRFSCVRALKGLGQDEQAFALLERGGGLELEDLREGEDSVGQVWAQLYRNLYGEQKEIPHKYNFRAF